MSTRSVTVAFRDHGRLRASLGQHVPDARQVIEALESTGISLHDVTDRLLENGVALFNQAVETLLSAVDKGRQGR
jgi:exonuclease VII small subunit